MNQLRVFIAIHFPESIQDSIEKQTARLRQSLGNDIIRWVAPQNMHLTLKFIGNIAAAHLDFLKQMLVQTADSHSSLELQIGGIGSFPNSKRPRVLWVGIHAPAELASLQRNIEAGSVRLGYEKEERPFSPHLTLGRVRQTARPSDLQKVRTALEGTQIGRIGTVPVHAVHLYQSELRPEGSVYTRLFSAPLNKTFQ
ncbi:MAG TPA: RNA 2',3'-cyclic phosphodiesterase [Anaerolineales bacterium]|nr:RNA 2',3'-cyclic phosphodiesterase [Anaerolineales bacterium]